MLILKAIMIGDVVGEAGLAVLENRLPALIKENAADFVVVNGENAAEGFGLTEACLKRILASGADVVTSGNHVWEKRDFWPFLESEQRILRPGNYPEGSPGRGWVHIEKAADNDMTSDNGAGESRVVSWLVVNLQGREQMPDIDCPFKCFDAIAAEAAAAGLKMETGSQDRPPIVLVDFHAESTEEKETLAYFLDGRVSMVTGTHTHVQTADERILPKGTAYITDLGMTGVTDSVIGMDKKICLDRARTQVLFRMECAQAGPDGQGAAIHGVIAEIDADNGKALTIKRLN
jgi:metallophosphoesterase (TIGR00282 family)